MCGLVYFGFSSGGDGRTTRFVGARLLGRYCIRCSVYYHAGPFLRTALALALPSSPRGITFAVAGGSRFSALYVSDKHGFSFFLAAFVSPCVTSHFGKRTYRWRALRFAASLAGTPERHLRLVLFSRLAAHTVYDDVFKAFCPRCRVLPPRTSLTPSPPWQAGRRAGLRCHHWLPVLVERRWRTICVDVTSSRTRGLAGRAVRGSTASAARSVALAAPSTATWRQDVWRTVRARRERERRSGGAPICRRAPLRMHSTRFDRRILRLPFLTAFCREQTLRLAWNDAFIAFSCGHAQ